MASWGIIEVAVFDAETQRREGAKRECVDPAATVAIEREGKPEVIYPVGGVG